MIVSANEGKFDPSEIDPSANFLDYGYIDSLTGVVFLAEIEERFGGEHHDKEVVERLTSHQELAEHLAAQVARAAG